MHGSEPMETRVLRYFSEIVREGNISNAARHLHVSQPALSRQIMDLETELGVTLFERGHRQIKLTQEGHYLYRRSQEILAMIDKTEYHLQGQDMISGVLDIGAGESASLKPVMKVIHQIMQEYPEVKVNLVSGDSELIRQRVNNGVLEFGILMGHENMINYATLELPHPNRWGVLMRSDSPLAQQTEIRPSDLIGHPLMASAQTRRQDTFRHWAGELLGQFKFVGNYNLLYNAALLAQTGACLVLTYQDLINTSASQNLAFRPLSSQVVDNNTLIWSKDKPLSNLSQLFLRLLQSEIKKEKLVN